MATVLRLLLLAPLTLAASSSLGVGRLRPDDSHPHRHDRPVLFTFAPTAEGLRGVSMKKFQLTVTQGDAVVAQRTAFSSIPSMALRLRPGRYSWSVQWWTSTGEASPVERSSVVVASSGDVWTHVPWLGSNSSNEFMAEVQPHPSLTGRAELLVATLGFGYVTINGQEVSQDILSYSGWTNTDKRVLYRTYDVTSLLNASLGGTIFVGLGCGYRCDPKGRFPAYQDQADRSQDSVPKIFRLQLRIGDNPAFDTGSNAWLMRQGPVVEDSVYDGEIYMPAAVSAWVPAPQLPAGWGPRGAMVPATFPGVQVTRVDAPVSITQPAPGVHVVDFGSNVAGVCSISVPEAATVSLRHGELMQHEHLPGLENPDPSRVYFDNYRTAQANDTLVLTEPVVNWRPRFTYRGFRYVEVYGYPGELTSDAIRRLRINTALEDKTNLTFGDEVLQAIHEGSKGSQRSNLMQVPTDCPQRDERLGWMGDASLSAESMLMHFHYAGMSLAFLDTMADELGADGSLPDVVPYQRYGGRPADLSWSGAFLENIWAIWKVEGDLTVAREHWDHIKQQLANVEAQYQNAGSMGSLPEPYGDWCPPPKTPGSTDQERSSRGFAAGFSLLSTLRQAAELGRALGGTAAQDAAGYEALYQKVLPEYHSVHYDGTKKQYDNGVMITYLLPLVAGATPDAEKPAVLKGLLDHIQANNGTWTGGIINNKFLFDLLADNGRADLTLAMLKRKEYPSYGYMYFNDLEPAKECMWELPDAPFQGTGMNSRNHHMFSSVGHYLIRLAGLEQTPRGFRGSSFTAVVPPASFGKELPSAAASMRTVRGDVRFAWSWTSEALAVDVSVPVGMQAMLHVPQEAAQQLRLDGAPVVVGTAGVKAVEASELRGTATTRLVLGSGSYSFKSSAREAVAFV